MTVMKFKRFFTFFLVFCASQVHGAEWYLARSIDGVEFWKHPEIKDARVLVQHQLSKNTFKPDFYKSSKFQKDLQENKKKTLSYFGVNDWQFEISETRIQKDTAEITFHGSYRDKDNEKTSFFEKHYYREDNFTQILFTTSIDDKSVNQQRFNDYIKHFSQQSDKREKR